MARLAFSCKNVLENCDKLTAPIITSIQNQQVGLIWHNTGLAPKQIYVGHFYCAWIKVLGTEFFMLSNFAEVRKVVEFTKNDTVVKWHFQTWHIAVSFNTCSFVLHEPISSGGKKKKKLCPINFIHLAMCGISRCVQIQVTPTARHSLHTIGGAPDLKH